MAGAPRHVRYLLNVSCVPLLIALTPAVASAATRMAPAASGTVRKVAADARARYATLVPLISEVQPAKAITGTPGLVLEVRSTNYDSTAVCRWDGIDLYTNALNIGVVFCWVPPDRLSAPGIHRLTVFNPGPFGGESEPFLFEVRDPTTFWVDDDAPSDPAPSDPNVSDPLEDGTPEHPFDRVQEGLDQSLGPDVIRIMPGRYRESLDIRWGYGARIVGSGKEVTTLSAASGTLLQAIVADPYPSSPVLSLSDLTVEGDVIVWDWSYIESGPTEIRLNDLAVRSGTLLLGAGLWTHATLERIALSDAEIDFIGATAGALEADVGALEAPDSGVRLDASGLEGYVWMNLSDSVVSHVDVENYWDSIGAGLSAQRVNFTGLGVIARGGACFLSIDVADSTFAQGGIDVQGYGGGTDLCWGTWVQARVTHSTFACEGVQFHGTYGRATEWWPVYGDLFALEATSSRFALKGIQVGTRRGQSVGEPWGYSADLRLTNNLFEGAEAGLGVHYGYSNDGTDPWTGSTASLLEVVNNTSSRAEVGVEVATDDHQAGFDTYETRIINNIIERGGTGLRIDGTQDHQITVAANDVCGNSVADYAGDITDQTGLNGNISKDPRFRDPAAGDHALGIGSPCVDAGLDGPGTPPADVNGIPRPQDGDGDGVARTDIGACELRPMDEDGDGYLAWVDCDDGDPGVHPGAVDIPGDAIDQDCDGAASCDPRGAWLTHGRFVQCVSQACAALAKDGRLTASECGAIVARAARSEAGGH